MSEDAATVGMPHLAVGRPSTDGRDAASRVRRQRAMAVKLMVAPAIAKGEIGKKDKVAVLRTKKEPGEPAKPKRRRSSVYDADGNEVFITLMCLKCHKMRPLSQFGLRKMADGAIRNQPWCRTCRSGTSEKPRKGAAETAESVAAEASAPEVAAPDVAPVSAAEPRRSSSMAADIAAALAAGRG
jgi:hypothetical protein